MNSAGADESVVVGRFNGPWGVQGWVKVFSHTRPAPAIFEYQPWIIGDGGEPVTVEQWRQAGPRLVARIAGISTPEQAAALGRQTIAVPRSVLPSPEPGEHYWHDLVGLEVVNLQDHSWGRVERLVETGAHDVLEVVDGEGRSVLIPFVAGEFIHQVDHDSGRITVDWPVEWEQSDA